MRPNLSRLRGLWFIQYAMSCCMTLTRSKPKTCGKRRRKETMVSERLQRKCRSEHCSVYPRSLPPVVQPNSLCYTPSMLVSNGSIQRITSHTLYSGGVICFQNEQDTSPRGIFTKRPNHSSQRGRSSESLSRLTLHLQLNILYVKLLCSNHADGPHAA